MSSMLLINPRRRRAAKRTPAVAAKRKRRRNPVSVVSLSPVRRKRRRNPVRAHRARRRNPIAAHRARRRRNPIGGSMRSMSSGIINMLKDAMIGGAGAVAVELVMGQVNTYLPVSMQRTAGSVSVGDAVKAGITVILGKLLSKPTRGLSQKMAAGALTVQAASLVRMMIPSTMTLGNGMGYAVPAQLVNANLRVGPNRQRMSQYVSGNTPLLNQYVTGANPLLNGAPGSARMREGILYR